MKAVISLGSNLSEPKENLDLAISLLKEVTEVKAISKYFETKPVGFTDQPNFLNAIVILSALPTGTGPFMLAQYYKADGSVISRVVLITTVGSLLTLSLFLWWNSRI